ncbi:MAG: acyl-CoA dehydrogenase [Rhodocyclaceae bacterium]|nr:acyl-CoA dehydrogenase [Rhodocyclaceae bacterium]MBX3670575.1 acyl-CoA dehydrogenase [Rhodocyclaceae bacterium]
MTYSAPLRDLQFAIHELAAYDRVAALPGYEEFTPDLVDAVLEEAAKLAANVIAPINRAGDTNGSRWADRQVTTPPGWSDAYQQFVDGGWCGLGSNPEYGGQGMPKLVSAAVAEMWKSANMAFALCPMLTIGATEAIELNGSAEVKQTYLPNMIAGKWTGTMNLTEPQAGSDLAAVRSRAEPQGDGTYRIFGQKIFITYGEHDLTENIIHLVLARLPDAPPGVKGISLFVVPKFLVNADGSLGARNDVQCVSIEHKLGIHGSPTCVLAFGDAGGAQGVLVGEANRGLEYMFVMMNAARFAVGQEGIAISERAYQKAAQYARERVQGPELGGASAEKVAIIRHPDVRRMLMLMRAQTEAMRGLALVVAAAIDAADCHPDATERARNQAFADLLVPVIKGWCTETGVEIASLGVQVHGGMGFIEETGAAQFLRDARITTIYEGTTGIQANDLMGRKIAREAGTTLFALVAVMRADCAALAASGDADLAGIAARLAPGIDAAEAAGRYIVENFRRDVKTVSAGAVPFLRLLGIVAGGWQIGRAASLAAQKVAAGSSDPFYAAKIVSARFFAEHVLCQAQGLAQCVMNGGASVMALDESLF